MTCTLADLENKVHSHSATLHPGKGTHVKYQEDSGVTFDRLTLLTYSQREVGGGEGGAGCLLPFILSFCLHILRKRERTIKRERGRKGDKQIICLENYYYLHLHKQHDYTAFPS